jgi:antitoxin HicB
MMEPAELLKKPYARLVLPDTDGTFTAEIVEFPGCISVGDTAVEALANLEKVAVDWIAATVEQGQDIPEPMESSGYSGKLVLRMQKSLHKKATLFAEREGVSLNTFIVTCLAEAVGERARPVTWAYQPQAEAISHLYAQLVGSVTPVAIETGHVKPAPLVGTAKTGDRIFTYPIRREGLGTWLK